MSGKHSHMNPLELRKQFLIAESEINRVQLVADLTAIKTNVRAFTDCAKPFRLIASFAKPLLAVFHRDKPVEAEAKPSLLQTVLKSAGLISTIWMAFRPRSCEEKDK